MLNVLLIYDDQSATLTVQQVLTRMNITPVNLIIEEFHPEFLSAEMFDLLVFELFGENRSCVAILKQLEKWTATSGMDAPPVIVVTEDGLVEQALRTAKVNFFFIKPVAELDLIAAINQALPPTSR